MKSRQAHGPDWDGELTRKGGVSLRVGHRLTWTVATRMKSILFYSFAAPVLQFGQFCIDWRETVQALELRRGIGSNI